MGLLEEWRVEIRITIPQAIIVFLSAYDRVQSSIDPGKPLPIYLHQFRLGKQDIERDVSKLLLELKNDLGR